MIRAPGTTPRPLRQRLADREPLLATFNLIPSTDVAELLCLAGFQLVVVDMEHGVHTLESARAAIAAVQFRGGQAVVRVAAPDPAAISAALDAGADGVLVPQVSAAASAAAVVRAARFPPDGERGSNPWVRAAAYAGGPEWYAQANSDIAVLVMVEGAEGVAAAAEIVRTPGLDAVFLGPVDLSASLGVPGQLLHPAVLAATAEVSRQAAAAGVATAVFTRDASNARPWWDSGATVVACGVDTDLILRSLQAQSAQAAPAAGRATS